MPTAVILGVQWGDEGKGKLVDYLTERAHVVARFQGGHNAGHTVVIDETQYILHLVPSGILHSDTLSVIGGGTVIDPRCLIAEMDGLATKGIKVTRENLVISKGAHLIMPYHMAIEAAEEKLLGSDLIGTTLKGIGPAYTDKMARVGLKVADLMQPGVFREKLAAVLTRKNILLEKVFNEPGFDLDAVYDEFMGYAKRLAPHVADTEVLVNQAIDEGKNVLFEGAQGTLLDIDHGTYPFVTSSSASAGGICTGLGVGPNRIDRLTGVVKAYTTRVGSGPFPTELTGPLGAHLQERGGEFGATTGRPRRCGWLDMVALRYTAMINGLTGIAITKLDILDEMEEIKVCTHYLVDGQKVEHFPKEASVVARCEPQYESFPGWRSNTRGATEFDSLPEAARNYLRGVERLLGVPIEMISTGPKREELILLKKPFQ